MSQQSGFRVGDVVRLRSDGSLWAIGTAPADGRFFGLRLSGDKREYDTLPEENCERTDIPLPDDIRVEQETRDVLRVLDPPHA